MLRSIQLAKDCKARITGISVVPQFHVWTFNAMMIADTKETFIAESRVHATKYLTALKKAAEEEGVPCDTELALSDHPYEAIISTATSKGCDLIMMASHGRRGVQSLLIGSETQKVLTHCKIPVLVYR